MYRFAYVLCSIWFFLTNHRVRVHHRERLPEGACILCPNHTALRDPVYVANACGIRAKLRFMAKSELYENRLLGRFLRSLGAYPVKRGRADIEAIRQSLAYLQEGCSLIIFPEGTRVINGKDSEAKGGAAMLASRSGAPMVPVYLENARTFFKPVELTFGEPIAVGRSRQEQKDAVEKVMKAIEDMKCQSK